MTRINREMVPKFFPARCCDIAAACKDLSVYCRNSLMPDTAGMSGQFEVGRQVCADARVYMACVISVRRAALCTWYVGVSWAAARVYACFTKAAGSCENNSNKPTSAEHTYTAALSTALLTGLSYKRVSRLRQA